MTESSCRVIKLISCWIVPFVGLGVKLGLSFSVMDFNLTQPEPMDPSYSPDFATFLCDVRIA